MIIHSLSTKGRRFLYHRSEGVSECGLEQWLQLQAGWEPGSQTCHRWRLCCLVLWFHPWYLCCLVCCWMPSHVVETIPLWSGIIMLTNFGKQAQKQLYPNEDMVGRTTSNNMVSKGHFIILFNHLKENVEFDSWPNCKSFQGSYLNNRVPFI